MRLKGKVAIITGSTSGIGKATAALFAQEEAKVVVVGRRFETGEIVTGEIKKRGGEAIFVKTDISDPEQVKRLLERTFAVYGKVDILFNNAGILPESAKKPIADCSIEEWDHMMTVNAKGVFITSKYVIPEMINNGGGVIINTSSQLAFVAIKGRGIYSASKSAVAMLTKAIAIEYAPYHIRANCICPGLVETEIGMPIIREAQKDEKTWTSLIEKYPIGRLGKPEDIAHAALFLASDESSWITGSCLMIDGGYTAL